MSKNIRPEPALPKKARRPLPPARTLTDVLGELRRVYNHPEFEVEGFSFTCRTSDGARLSLAWGKIEIQRPDKNAAKAAARRAATAPQGTVAAG